jgi:predicted lipid-binding transport protein (Tim44 family)
MGESFQGLEILIWAAVAGIVLFRLRSVLGRRTGNERPPRDRLSQESSPSGAPDNTHADKPRDTVVALSPGGRAKRTTGAPHDRAAAEAVGIDPASPLADALSRIRVADRHFEPAEFVDGAKAAYHMIIEAFASGDEAVLKPLLSPDVMANFRSAISKRASKGQTVNSKVTEIVKSVIKEAALHGTTAEITVRFESEIIRCVRDSENRVIEGDPSDPARVIDVWTFARDVESDDPNWTLVATSTEH